MDAAAYFDRLLSGNGLTLHFTHTSDAEIPTLEFGFVRPPQYQWLSFCRYSCGIIPLFMMFTSAPVSMRARMEKVFPSAMTSNHTFKLSGCSLDLDLLVWFINFPLPVTLGHEALYWVSDSSGLWLLFPRSARATDTERFGSWGFSASPPVRDRPPYACLSFIRSDSR